VQSGRILCAAREGEGQDPPEAGLGDPQLQSGTVQVVDGPVVEGPRRVRQAALGVDEGEVQLRAGAEEAQAGGQPGGGEGLQSR